MRNLFSFWFYNLNKKYFLSPDWKEIYIISFELSLADIDSKTDDGLKTKINFLLFIFFVFSSLNLCVFRDWTRPRTFPLCHDRSIKWHSQFSDIWYQILILWSAADAIASTVCQKTWSLLLETWISAPRHWDCLKELSIAGQIDALFKLQRRTSAIFFWNMSSKISVPTLSTARGFRSLEFF